MILSEMAMTDLYSHHEINEDIMGEKQDYGKNGRIVLHTETSTVYLLK